MGSIRQKRALNSDATFLGQSLHRGMTYKQKSPPSSLADSFHKFIPSIIC